MNEWVWPSNLLPTCKICIKASLELCFFFFLLWKACYYHTCGKLEKQQTTLQAHKQFLPVRCFMLYVFFTVENINAEFLLYFLCFYWFLRLHRANGLIESLISLNSVFMNPFSFMHIMFTVPCTKNLSLLLAYKVCHHEINVKLCMLLA